MTGDRPTFGFKGCGESVIQPSYAINEDYSLVSFEQLDDCWKFADVGFAVYEHKKWGREGVKVKNFNSLKLQP